MLYTFLPKRKKGKIKGSQNEQKELTWEELEWVFGERGMLIS